MTALTEHAPGPWNVELFGDGCFEINIGDDGDYRVLCSRSPWPNNKGESEANAVLIAAAPDMIKALEDIAAVEPTPGKAARNRGAMLQMQALARRAIAKAKGESA